MKAVKNFILSLAIIMAVHIICVGQHSPATLQWSFKPILFKWDTTRMKTIQFIPNTYNIHTQPIFCKWEEKWTRTSNINLRMRIGSLQYVDYLEGKIK